MGLEAEAVLQGKTLKKLASELILKSISNKALQFIQKSNRSAYVEKAKEGSVGIRNHRLKISENADVIEQIKVLWSQNPRPSQREIAKIIEYPASSTKYQIKSMRERAS